MREGGAEPIAIVGMACRFPGAGDISSFWKLLEAGGNSIIEAPPTRWNLDALRRINNGAPVPPQVTRGGWLERVGDFDAPFFRMSPREAKHLDPKQRLMIEVAYEAFEDANLATDQLTGRTGVFTGTAHSEYLIRFYHRGELGQERYVGPGNDFSLTCGRIAGLFGLEGPAINVNTACSTSLVAVHLACQAIRNGECSIAAAGGVSIIECPENALLMTDFNVLAPDSQCKAFDASADGYVRAEGAGCIILRKLSDAVAAGDRILGVVRGTAVNHNGLTDNLMAPDSDAQEALMRQALADGGLAADTIDFLEAHGTGTGLGDPTEMEAVRRVFRDRPASQPLTIASVKTNIGHLEVAAGIAGMIRALLALQHRRYTPHLHLTELNPDIADDFPFTIPTVSADWAEPDGRPRRAAVNSFGIGGTNAHVILEDAPARTPVPADPAARGSELLLLSAAGDDALKQLATDYAAHLQRPGVTLHDTCYTAATGRNRHPRCLTLTAPDVDHAIDALQAFARGDQAVGVRVADVRAGAPKVAFLFTGQGAQHVGMGADLYRTERVCRETVDACDALLAPLLGRSIRAIILGEDPDASIDDTAYTQPGLFVLEVALARLWMSWGIRPSVMAGHSIGELAAAHLAGVFSLEDALTVVAARGRLMSALPRDGSMAAIFAGVDLVRPLVEGNDQVSIAADNGPRSVVISGRTAAVEAVAAAFEAKEIGVRRLTVSHAFHSALMDPMLEDFRAVLDGVQLSEPTIPILSNLTGEPADSSMATADYWVRHVREAVRFREAIDRLATHGVDAVLEIGPDAVLTGMGRRCVPSWKTRWVPSLRKDRGWDTLLDAAVELHLAGAPLDHAAFYADRRGTRIPLPAYPYQRKTYWVDDPGPPVWGAAAQRAPVAPVEEAKARPFRLRWFPVDDVGGPAPAAGEALVLAGPGSVGDAAVAALTTQGHRVTRIGPSELDPRNRDAFLAAVQARPDLRVAVHAWSLGAASGEELSCEDHVMAQDLASISALHLAQAMLAAGPKDARTWFVTRGADVVTGAEDVNLAAAAIWGLARVIKLEHRDALLTRVDLDPAAPDGGAAGLAALLDAPPPVEDQLALRRHTTHAQRLVRHTPSGVTLTPRPHGAWLITGGLGSLGLAVAEWLAAQGADKLILCGRSAPKPEAAAVVARIEAAGTQVLVEAVDVSDATQVANLFAYVARKGVNIRGIVHAAGVLADGPVLRQTVDDFHKVFGPKISGSWHLHQASKALDLDAFVLFSSVTSSIGAPGQADYAAANAFMDALAWRRRRLGLPAVSINWGPWGEIGMAAKLAQLMASRGMGGVATADGLAALGSMGADDLAQVAFMDMKVEQLYRTQPAFRTAPLVAELVRPLSAPPPVAAPAPAAAAAPVPHTVTLIDRLKAAPPAERPGMVADRVAELAEDQLGNDRGSLSHTKPLAWQGLDSVTALDLSNALVEAFGVEVELSSVTVGPPIKELAEIVIELLAMPATVVPLPIAAPLSAPLPTAAAPDSWAGALALAPEADREALLLARLRGLAESIMGFNPGDLDPHRPMAWQGFDSVIAVDLHAAIVAETGSDLELDHLIHGPRLTEIAAELLPRIDLSRPPAAPPPPVAPRPEPTPEPTPPAPTATTPPDAASQPAIPSFAWVAAAVLIVVAILFGGWFMSTPDDAPGTHQPAARAKAKAKTKARQRP